MMSLKRLLVVRCDVIDRMGLSRSGVIVVGGVRV